MSKRHFIVLVAFFLTLMTTFIAWEMRQRNDANERIFRLEQQAADLRMELAEKTVKSPPVSEEETKRAANEIRLAELSNQKLAYKDEMKAYETLEKRIGQTKNAINTQYARLRNDRPGVLAITDSVVAEINASAYTADIPCHVGASPATPVETANAELEVCFQALNDKSLKAINAALKIESEIFRLTAANIVTKNPSFSE